MQEVLERGRCLTPAGHPPGEAGRASRVLRPWDTTAPSPTQAPQVVHRALEPLAAQPASTPPSPRSGPGQSCHPGVSTSSSREVRELAPPSHALDSGSQEDNREPLSKVVIPYLG